MEQQRSISDGTRRVVVWLIGAMALIHLAGLAKLFYLNNGLLFALVDDDSLITFRVAYNIAHGIGPFFNRGEHVAASTSLLWPFVIAPVFHHYTLPAAVMFLSKVSVALTVVILALVAFGASSVRCAIAGLATLVALPPFLHYAPTAWEHIPQTVFTTAAFLPLIRTDGFLKPYALQVCVVLLTVAYLFRPDALPLLTVCALVLATDLVRKREKGSFYALGFSIVCIAVYLGVHYHFYASFVPNTYYLKISFGFRSLHKGWIYTYNSARQCVAPLFVCASAMLFLADRRAWDRNEKIVLAALSAQYLYVLVIGGDVFDSARFYLLILPIAILLTYKKIEEQFFRSPCNLLSIGAVTLLVIGMLSSEVARQEGDSFAHPYKWSRGQLTTPEVFAADPRLGQLELIPVIRDNIRPEDGRIGLFWLGALGYYLPEYTMADFFGKADPVIAHGPAKEGWVGQNKWDIDFTLRDRNVAAVPMDRDDQSFKSGEPADAFEALAVNRYLKENYVWLSPESLGVDNWGMYVRKDLVGRFQCASMDAH